MYVWNGFKVVGKRADLTENILSTLDKAEEQLQNDPGEMTEFNNRYSLSLMQIKLKVCVMMRSSIRVPPG